MPITCPLVPLSAFTFALIVAAVAAAPLPGQQPPAPTTPAPETRDQVIRSRADLVTSDVFVRDDKGMFVADLKKTDFEIFEDGVRQELVTLILSQGGRVFNIESAAPPALRDGILVPPTRPPGDGSGRVFLLFVDDLHLDFAQTARIRDLFRTIAKELIHPGDMFGIVSTGPSSLEINLTYDRKRLDAAITRIAGSSLSPAEIIAAPQTAQGVAEVRHRAHVAFSTAYEMLGELARITHLRKSFIYVSHGYDFDAFPEGRAKYEAQRYGRGETDPSAPANDPFAPGMYKFGHADLASELAEVIRAANRANASIYAIDPRGLSAGPDVDQPVNMTEWHRHVRSAQDTLRVLSEETGGLAIVNANDIVPGLKRIDAETSDYYIVGYYSSNPDPLKRRRTIEVKVKRPRVDVKHRTEYSLKRER